MRGMSNLMLYLVTALALILADAILLAAFSKTVGYESNAVIQYASSKSPGTVQGAWYYYEYFDEFTNSLMYHILVIVKSTSPHDVWGELKAYISGNLISLPSSYVMGNGEYRNGILHIYPHGTMKIVFSTSTLPDDIYVCTGGGCIRLERGGVISWYPTKLYNWTMPSSAIPVNETTAPITISRTVGVIVLAPQQTAFDTEKIPYCCPQFFNGTRSGGIPTSPGYVCYVGTGSITDISALYNIDLPPNSLLVYISNTTQFNFTINPIEVANGTIALPTGLNSTLTIAYDTSIFDSNLELTGTGCLYKKITLSATITPSPYRTFGQMRQALGARALYLLVKAKIPEEPGMFEEQIEIVYPGKGVSRERIPVASQTATQHPVEYVKITIEYPGSEIHEYWLSLGGVHVNAFLIPDSVSKINIIVTIYLSYYANPNICDGTCGGVVANLYPRIGFYTTVVPVYS